MFQSDFDIVMRLAWEPPPDLKVSDWADRYRKLSPEASAEPGQWHTSRAPYLRKIMDSYNDPYWTEIVGMLASQTAKTEVINNIVAYNIDTNPGPLLVIQPTLDMAEAWSKDRLAPMIRDTKPLNGKIQLSSRYSGNTLLHKQFPGGHLTIAGANSPSSLASRPMRDVYADEIDRYPPSAGNEGDPLNLAIARTANFWNSTIVMTSTPTIKGASRIESAYGKSQQHEYFVPCPHCGEMQTLRWKNVFIPKKKNGEHDTKRAFYVCKLNGCEIHEKSKSAMLEKGEWRLMKKGDLQHRIGFHINSIYSPWMKWAELADLFLEAGEEPELLQTFINTKLAETWEIRHANGVELRPGEHCEDYDKDSLPDKILLITGSVDVQKDRLEFLSQGWGEKRERWNIEHRIVWGDPEREDVWLEMDEILKQRYQLENGMTLPLACVTVDSGYLPDEVYNFCKPRQRYNIHPTKGSSKYYPPMVGKPSQAGHQRVMLYEVGSDTAKDSILYSSLRLDEPGPGFIHHPKWCDQEYFDQLSMSEVRYKNKPTDRLGRKKKVLRLFEYHKLRERNEILDLHVGNLAAYYILNPDIDAIINRRQNHVIEMNQEKVEPEADYQPLRRRPFNRKRNRKKWATDI